MCQISQKGVFELEGWENRYLELLKDISLYNIKATLLLSVNTDLKNNVS